MNRPQKRSLAKPATSKSPSVADFDEVLALIDAARTRAVSAVNKTLIDLYWAIGEHISRKIADDGWGKGTVQALGHHIQRHKPGMTGFSASNLWRMRQFFETYRKERKLAPLVRELKGAQEMSSRARQLGPFLPGLQGRR
jgi:hypothetical protein